MLKVKADTIVNLTQLSSRKIDKVFQLEQWLNGTVATEAYLRYGVELRFHFSLEEDHPKRKESKQ